MLADTANHLEVLVCKASWLNEVCLRSWRNWQARLLEVHVPVTVWWSKSSGPHHVSGNFNFAAEDDVRPYRL